MADLLENIPRVTTTNNDIDPTYIFLTYGTSVLHTRLVPRAAIRQYEQVGAVIRSEFSLPAGPTLLRFETTWRGREVSFGERAWAIIDQIEELRIVPV
jgi:hypothetical protein